MSSRLVLTKNVGPTVRKSHFKCFLSLSNNVMMVGLQNNRLQYHDVKETVLEYAWLA